MSPRSAFGILVAICLCFFVATTARAQFGNLTKRVPDGANTLILIDVEKLMASPLAKKEGWADNHRNSFDSGMMMVPPDATKFVKAAELDIDSLEPEWEVSLADLTHEPDVAKAAVRYSGTVDRIGGRDVVVLPGDMYGVKFSRNTVGVGAPAKRQDVSRWLTRMDASTLRGLSKYLTESTSFANRGTPIIMAMDLTDAVAPSLVAERLAKFEAFKDKGIDLVKAADAIASIRGVSLGIVITEKRIGAVKVDFAKDISFLKDVAKPILLQVLANQGAMIDEFEDWDVLVTKNRVQLTGELQPSGARRILSLLEPPPSLREARKRSEQAGDQENQKKLVIVASQQYFKTVSTLVDDLRGRRKRSKTLGQVGVWFGKYARKIDRLSPYNVDEDLQQYGKYVADSMRDSHTAIQGASARSRTRQMDVPEQYDIQTYSVPIGVVGGGYGWGGWRGGSVGYSANYWSATANRHRRGRLQAQVRTQERIAGNTSANLIMQGIEEATADMRRHLTQKYSAPF